MFFILTTLIFSQIPIELTPKTYKTFYGSAYPTIIKFYLPTCPHCKIFTRPFKEVANYFENILFAQVNCQLYHDFCQNLNINSFPTIYFFRAGSIHPILYDEESSTDSLIEFLEFNTKYKAHKPTPMDINVNESNIHNYVKNGKCTLLIFFEPNNELSQQFITDVQWAADVFQFDENISIGLVNCNKEHHLCDVEDKPYVKFFRNGKKEEFNRQYDLNGIVTFLNEQCQTRRSSDGYVDELYGVINEAKPFLKIFLKGQKLKNITQMKEAYQLMKNINGTQHYLTIMNDILNKGYDSVQNDYDQLKIQIKEGVKNKDNFNKMNLKKEISNIYALFFPNKLKIPIKKAKPIIINPNDPLPLNVKNHINL